MELAGPELSSFDGVHLVDRPWFPYLCTEVENWEWSTKGDAHFNLWIALGGEGTLSTEGLTFRITPGTFFIFSPEQVIDAAHTFGERLTRFSAHFIPLSGSTVLESVAGFPLLGGEVQALEPLQRQIDAIMRLAFRRKDELLLHRRIYQLIAELVENRTASPEHRVDPQVSKAIRWMRTNPASVDSMETLAKRLNWSRSHFDRQFSAQVGQPPKQFLLNCKMVEARRALESSHRRVGEIAEDLGYRDIYFFSRQFKGFFGVSPQNYRKGFRT